MIDDIIDEISGIDLGPIQSMDTKNQRAIESVIQQQSEAISSIVQQLSLLGQQFDALAEELNVMAQQIERRMEEQKNARRIVKAEAIKDEDGRMKAARVTRADGSVDTIMAQLH